MNNLPITLLDRVGLSAYLLLFFSTSVFKPKHVLQNFVPHRTVTDLLVPLLPYNVMYIVPQKRPACCQL